jgi:hypothetical protein
MKHGQLVAGANAVQVPIKGHITFKAHPDNTNNVFIGTAGVTTSTGFPLDSGQEVRIWTYDEPWVIGDAASQTVSYIVHDKN